MSLYLCRCVIFFNFPYQFVFVDIRSPDVWSLMFLSDRLVFRRPFNWSLYVSTFVHVRLGSCTFCCVRYCVRFVTVSVAFWRCRSSVIRFRFFIICWILLTGALRLSKDGLFVKELTLYDFSAYIHVYCAFVTLPSCVQSLFGYSFVYFVCVVWYPVKLIVCMDGWGEVFLSIFFYEWAVVWPLPISELWL